MNEVYQVKITNASFYVVCVCCLCGVLSAAKIDESPMQISPNPLAKNLRTQIENIDSALQKNDSVWLKRYTNYTEYHTISNQIDKIKDDLKNIDSSNPQSLQLIVEKKHILETLEKQLDILKDYKDNPFQDLIQKPEIPEPPIISNPLIIFSGISYIKNLQTQRNTLESTKNSLNGVMALVNNKYNLLIELSKVDKSPTIIEDIYSVQIELLEFQGAHNILSTTIDIYNKKYDEVYGQIYSGIKTQILKLGYIGMAVLISIGLALLLKIIVRRYIKDNERTYTFSKVINFFNITIIVLILLFSYMENVTYVVAVLGFASAGLAIAMKDLFMSVLGWIVIVIGGSIHVGDRIRVEKDGSIYIGDVLDISMLRITIHEDITLTSYMTNGRAGRIIFIPNNYIFTMMIANYTHGGMRTVWDGIDFSITFDSNYQKAVKIATEVAIKYSKGYTQVTKKQLRKMRDKYSLRNSNTEPRTYSFIEPNGIKISVWYQTNSYATLSLRSTISLEIMQLILKEPDIFIAYDTTKFVQTPNDGFGNKDITKRAIATDTQDNKDNDV